MCVRCMRNVDYDKIPDEDQSVGGLDDCDDNSLMEMITDAQHTYRSAVTIKVIFLEIFYLACLLIVE